MYKIAGWMLAFLLLLAMPAAALPSPDLTGQRQGTFNAGKTLRVILRFARGTDKAITGQLYSIDQSARSRHGRPKSARLRPAMMSITVVTQRGL